MAKRISIIGCGWFGLPLGAQLAKTGFSVKGSTTSPDKLSTLEKAGIQGHVISLPNETTGIASLLDTEILIVNIPPSNKKGGHTYAEQVQYLVDQIQSSAIKKVIFISTTAVYANLNRVVVEQDADYISSPHSGTVMLTMEELFTHNSHFQTTVIRFGGLYGSGRNPGRFLAGKVGLKGGQNPVNMIHLADCIGVIESILKLELWGDVFNACADEHPSRKDFYTAASLTTGLTPPAFAPDETSPYKIVSSDKFKASTQYQFKYPNPLTSL